MCVYELYFSLLLPRGCGSDTLSLRISVLLGTERGESGSFMNPLGQALGVCLQSCEVPGLLVRESSAETISLSPAEVFL